MSDKIQRSVYYYELLAKKHGAGGLGENQSRVYEELTGLVGECSTLEEIQRKMRAGGFFEKPAQALFLDKMAAHAKAAEEHDFPEIARIYRKKFEAVQADYQAAFTTGWEQEVGRELNRIGNIVGALNDIFAAYLRFEGTHPASADHRAAADKVRQQAATIEANGESFDAVVDRPYFRRHSPLDDRRYVLARDGVREILAGGADSQRDTEAIEDIQRRTAAALKIIEARQSELKELGGRFQERCKRSVWLSVAPETEAGPYAREVFYEGPAQ